MAVEARGPGIDGTAGMVPYPVLPYAGSTSGRTASCYQTVPRDVRPWSSTCCCRTHCFTQKCYPVISTPRQPTRIAVCNLSAVLPIPSHPPAALQPYYNRFSYILPSGYGASCGWSGLGDIPVPYTIPGLAENFGKRVGRSRLPVVAAGQHG